VNIITGRTSLERTLTKARVTSQPAEPYPKRHNVTVTVAERQEGCGRLAHGECVLMTRRFVSVAEHSQTTSPEAHSLQPADAAVQGRRNRSKPAPAELVVAAPASLYKPKSSAYRYFALVFREMPNFSGWCGRQ
jgi:hypothetical protein